MRTYIKVEVIKCQARKGDTLINIGFLHKSNRENVDDVFRLYSFETGAAGEETVFSIPGGKQREGGSAWQCEQQELKSADEL